MYIIVLCISLIITALQGSVGTEEPPGVPLFVASPLDPTDGLMKLLVQWFPSKLSRGTGFYVQYKPRDDDCQWVTTPMETMKDYIVVSELEHGTVYEMKVVAFDGQYETPSDVRNVSIEAKAPDPVPYFHAKPIGYDALYLMWGLPDDSKVVLTGFNIYCFEDLGDSFGWRRKFEVSNPIETRTKLTGLQPSTRYRLIIRTNTSKGEGDPYYLDTKTNRKEERIPDPPSFLWSNLDPDSGKARVRITWIPALDGHPGRDFYVQYKPKGECAWEKTTTEKEKVFITLSGLEHGTAYQMGVVAVEGQYKKISEKKEVITLASG